MKWNLTFGLFLLLQISFGQIKISSYSATSNIAGGSSAFLDASSSSLWNNSTNLGKGLLFPSVDLTLMAAMSHSGTIGASSNPKRFDGMLVYNTATGTSVIGTVAVKPGFYYYSNSSTNINGGTWVAVGAKEEVLSPSVVTKTADYLIANSDSTILCNAGTAGFTVTLPDPSTHIGKTFIIRKIDRTDNVLNFSPSIVFIDGITVSSLNFPKTVRVQSNGVNWVVID